MNFEALGHRSKLQQFKRHVSSMLEARPAGLSPAGELSLKSVFFSETDQNGSITEVARGSIGPGGVDAGELRLMGLFAPCLRCLTFQLAFKHIATQFTEDLYSNHGQALHPSTAYSSFLTSLWN